MAREKVPNAATDHPPKKDVRIPNRNTPEKPSWRFSCVDNQKNSPFRWPTGQEIEHDIINKLRDFESMHWEEIKRSQHHAIKKDKLSPQARKQLREIKQDDIDEVFSFRCSAKARIIGISDGNVIKLLWWDPEHGVCESTKRHT